MPQIRKKGAIFPIFADPSSPPRSSTVSTSSLATGTNSGAAVRRTEKNVSPGKKRVVVPGGGGGGGGSTKSRSLGGSSTTISTSTSGSSGSSARRVLSSKTISQAVPASIPARRDGKDGKGLGSGLDDEKVGSKGEKILGAAGPRSTASTLTMNTSTSASIGWEKPMLRKVKPVAVPSSGKVERGLFQVFEDGSSTSTRIGSARESARESGNGNKNTRRPLQLQPSSMVIQDRLPNPLTSSRTTSDPFEVSTRTNPSTDDKENLPPTANTSLSTRTPTRSPTTRTTRSPLNLESLGDAILAPPSSSSAAPAAREGLSPRHMELGYGRGRKAGKVLQAAWKESGVNVEGVEEDDGGEGAEEVLHDTPIMENEVDPLLPPFGMTTPAKRTKVIHSRTASEDSPSKWSAAVLASSTTTPLKRTKAVTSTSTTTNNELVGLGFGLPMPGLDRRFQPDGPLADVSEAYGATRDVEPSGFREASRRAHAQQASWSGDWGMDVSAYPTARRD